MEVRRLARWGTVWALLAATGWAKPPEQFQVPVLDQGRMVEGTVTLSPPSEGVFDRLPLRPLPGLAPFLISQTVRFFTHEIQNRLHWRPALLQFGIQSVQVELSKEDLYFLRSAQIQDRWLVPRSDLREPGKTYYEGPLDLLPVHQVRFHHQPQLENGGILEAQFEHAGEWIAASEIESPWSVAEYRGVPLVFVSTGESWKESEAVELIDLSTHEAVVVSRRQIDQAQRGDGIDLFRVPRCLFELQKPGLWWARPKRALPGRVVASYRIHRNKRPEDLLHDIRRWQGGRFASKASKVWAGCAGKIATAKNLAIDELSLYLPFN